ncbi:MAG: malto-oligosyltrehalose trehalohydrolase [Actinomycetaceae bacterium]|nr:malto-oligosyltrehalose trehalohydrolase [Actinomycetaceae bacterium]
MPVWSSIASSVTLHIDDEGVSRTLDMEREGNWWVSPEELPTGVRYRYSVDGKDPVPDPRALRRPDGVHGASMTWAPPSRMEYDAGSVLGKVFYELHIGTFTREGTFDAAIEKLDHLARLGVDVIEVMPVSSFPGTFGWGYDGVSLYSTQESYGGPDGFRRYIDAAHKAGLAVCLDLVLNHFGPVGNYIALLDNYYSDKHETPWGPALDLDGKNAEHTRAHLMGAALYWLGDMGVDALRLDAVHALDDDSDYHFLAELSDKVAALEKQTGRTFTLIAESDLNDPAMVTPTSAGGRGMDAQWDDDLHHALHVLFTTENHGYYADFDAREVIVKAFEDVFFHNGTFSSFRDQNWGAPVDADMDRRKFLIFSQNHDQVGNRAIGDRPSRVLDENQLAAVAALVLLSPFTPMLFQGEEWASTSPFLFFSDQEGDEQMARAMRDGRRAEFASHGWDTIYGKHVEVPDPTARQTFEDSKLDWSEASGAQNQRMLRWYHSLINLRRETGTIGDGAKVSMEWVGDVLTLHLADFDVLVNFGDEDVAVDSDAVVLAWSDAPCEGALPKHEVVVLNRA